MTSKALPLMYTIITLYFAKSKYIYVAIIKVSLRGAIF